MNFLFGLVMLWHAAPRWLKFSIIAGILFFAAYCKTVVTRSDPIHAERLETLAEQETEPEKKEILKRAAVALRETTKRADAFENMAETLETKADKYDVVKWSAVGAVVLLLLGGAVYLLNRR